MPFSSAFRQLLSPNIDLQLLDCLAAVTPTSSSTSLVFNSAPAAVVQELESYQQHRHQLLALPFTSIDDYLSLLQTVSEAISKQRKELHRRSQAREGEEGGCSSRSRVLYFLAAAVSDFYVPPEHLPQHKIQSRPLQLSLPPQQQRDQQQQQQQEEEEPVEPPPRLLQLALHPVPKRLGTLVSDWAPGCFVTSFKLETDLALVVRKAEMALTSYDVHLVVANQLQVTPPPVPSRQPVAYHHAVEQSVSLSVSVRRCLYVMLHHIMLHYICHYLC